LFKDSTSIDVHIDVKKLQFKGKFKIDQQNEDTGESRNSGPSVGGDLLAKQSGQPKDSV
jgi:hypothetical protein